ncbi:uncharacterized protein LOC100840517 isoform X1 [Brachypodium distachyon]|uniref:At1g61320/AtMIF1 LRR domain-containing protein n=2 Tax=Brachypodium distachyon TaxID=15368 RepID=A0A0Q3GBD6_BRADI|nr:uncharacterized protein LOC100840517 isoform X1 [Brachypodium distachyon]KQK08696.1 hypothetical protein BRADI_2g43357v3 [Brachypodium distachyon]|eukprot:XP_014753607.1 uncharacterized protein LOC100840517 isoform X1 [Brachypodium distachyon]
MSKRDDSLLCQEDDNSFLWGKRLRDSGLNLPEDIWCHIHSLIPMEDSARSACVSQAFLHSWRRHPNLIFTPETLGFKRDACRKDDITRAFTSKVDRILKNHSGTGVKILELDIFDCRDLDICYLNNWLQIAITPGIEKLTLSLPSKCTEGYAFPCSLVFGQSGSSLRYLKLSNCAFRPTVGLDCLRSLTKLYLHTVPITGEELGYLLSCSFALQHLELRRCREIICLKIPCVLEQLSCLTVSSCSLLQMIESKAPNLCTVNFDGVLVQLSLGQSFRVKNLDMEYSNESNFLCYTITKLPYVVPNVEKLSLSSISERVHTPMAAAKFLHLKYLEIYLEGDLSPGYDYLSLVSFLDASPRLETFIFGVQQDDMMFDSILGGGLHMRQMPEHKHASLKDVKILGFCSAKSMVELTCHILKNATSLECITLDTIFDSEDTYNIGRCSETAARKTGECFPQTSQTMLEAYKGLMAIKTYILGKVPSAVKLDVRGPCSRCHTLELISR